MVYLIHFFVLVDMHNILLSISFMRNISYLLVLIFFVVACKEEERVESVYINNMYLDGCADTFCLYEADSISSCLIKYDIDGNCKEITNFENDVRFGDRLYLDDNKISRYLFMVNDSATTFDIQFDKNGKTDFEFGKPLVYCEIGLNATKDSDCVEMILSKVIYKDVILKFSTDGGKVYNKCNLIVSEDPRFINNYYFRYAFLLPKKNPHKNTMVCFYSIIETETIYNEKKEYKDTLCYYIKDEFLR